MVSLQLPLSEHPQAFQYVEAREESPAIFSSFSFVFPAQGNAPECMGSLVRLCFSQEVQISSFMSIGTVLQDIGFGSNAVTPQDHFCLQYNSTVTLAHASKWQHCSMETSSREQSGKKRNINHRMVGVGRDLCGSSGPTLLPKQGHLQQAAEDLVQVGLDYLQRRRLHSLPGQPVPVLRHPQRMSHSYSFRQGKGYLS